MNNKRFFEDTRYAISWGIAGLILVSGLLSLFLVAKTIATVDKMDDNDQFQKTITVSAEGEYVSVPDIGTFNFTVSETAESVEAAQNVATDKINKALDYLKKNGIEEKDLKTTSYNVNPRYEYQTQELCLTGNCRGQNVLVGYTVSQTVSVKIRDTKKAGDLLSGIGQFGISNVSGLQFVTEDEDYITDQSRKDAIKKAQAKAKDLAKNLGVSLGDVVGFSEDGGYYPVQYDKAYSLESASDVAVAPQIPTGENTTNVTVYITYEID